MKRIFYLLVFSVVIVSSFWLTSCNRCKDCTALGVTEEVCRDDYDSNADYKKAIEDLEDLGATCK